MQKGLLDDQTQYGAPPNVVVVPGPSMGGQPKYVASDAGSGGRFAERTGCRDPIWAIIFVLQLLGMIATSIYFTQQVANDSTAQTDESSIEQSFSLDSHRWGLIALFCVAGGVLSSVWLLIIKSFAERIIWFTLIFTPVMWAVFGLLFIAFGFIVPGVIFILISALNFLWAYLVRARVPFSAAILSTAVEVIRLYPATVYLALISIVFQAAWILVWLMGAASILRATDSNHYNSSTNTISGVYFLLLISLYWTAQVIKNIVHVSVAGTFASWYFLSPNAMPENPTLKSFKRASWTSLGSFCFGSFIVAVLKALRAVAEGGRRNRNTFVRCCMVAIYGKTYCEAAKATWELICARGFDLLINDNLIGPVLTLGAFIVAILTGCVGLVFAYDIWSFSDWVPWVVAGVLVGFCIAIVAMEVVESCVAACFVCFAEDPEALHRTKPQAYARLNDAVNSRLVILRAQQPPPSQ